MDASTPLTPPTPEGTPIQDSVASPAAVPKPPTRRKGPNASAIVVGLVAMVFAGLIIGRETLGIHLDWSRLGPGGIVSIGVLMVVIGAIGLVRRHDDI